MDGSGVLNVISAARSSATTKWTLNSGTLEISAGNNLGNNLNGADQLTFAGNSTLKTTTTGDTSAAAGRGFVINSGVVATFLANHDTYFFDFQNAITGSGSITKTGNGIHKFSSAANTFSGAMTVQSGTVRVGNVAAFQNANVTLSGGKLEFDGITSATFDHRLPIERKAEA